MLEERITHVRYALDRREEILKAKIDRRFVVSFTVVSRRLYKIPPLRLELDQIDALLVHNRPAAKKRLEQVENNLFGVL